MSVTPADETSECQPEPLADRYSQLLLDDEDPIIYDRENHAAWVQSSGAVSLLEYR
ncbi:hypothetical protein HLRTI_001963 [Halorhabdus tiamatea SARL4B]|uniref:DUF7331 family protein n=1 Tax=Halorhabdus tiamatea TaxID=430914 RepID=UPI00021213A4|nr:hypothetical protein [Halorhabdus tiamatea]ERJ06057.1 hypothetical protein HLRTI_001963 [Halorhabdus tiamatea SARL4B]